MSLSNPYRDYNPQPALHVISGKISQDDWLELKARLPRAGAVDAIISTLFYKLKSTYERVPIPTSAADVLRIEEQFARVILGCSFPPADGHGPVSDE